MSKLKEIKDREFIYGELPLSKDGKIIWKETIGKKFSIRYDGNVYNFIVIKYDNQNRIVYFDYNGEEYHMYTSGLLKCNIGFIAGLLTTNFKYNIGDIINGYEILEQVRIHKKNGKSYRAYRVKCIVDGYINIVSESSLDNGDGCPVCSNKVIVKGINDMWTTNPKLASLLADPNDGYIYCENTNKKVDWECPICKNIIKQKLITYIKRTMDVHCPFCGDGFSYPEKLMSNILSYFDVKFIHHYRIPNQYFIFNNKQYVPEYDFYFELNNKRYIIETDGGFHYKVHSKSDYTIEQIQEIDKNKDVLANKNNITIIRIDCKESDYDYIFNSMKNSLLNELFDLSILVKEDLNKKSYSNLLLEVCNLYMSKSRNLNTISKILNLNYGTVYRYLRRGKEIGLCNYDPMFTLKYKGHLDFLSTYPIEL